MKLITIHLGDKKIEVQNSFWGIETIRVNDELVSSKFSFFGTNHIFKQIENSEEILYEVKIRTGFGPVVDIYRQGNPILEFPKYGALRFFIYLIIILTIVKFLYDFIGHSSNAV